MDPDDPRNDTYEVTIGRIMRGWDYSREEAERMFVSLSRVFDREDEFPDGFLEKFVREAEQENIQRKSGK